MPHNSLQLPSPHKPDPQHLCSVATEGTWFLHPKAVFPRLSKTKYLCMMQT